MAEFVYDPKVVEARWQTWWAENRTNEVDLAAAKNPYYVLMMFPYPSAEGLHVGNVFAFTGADIQGRYRRLRGHDVFEPIGFDAFGIHSENFAMKVNRHPAELIPSNVANFTRQLTMMGFMFDWRRTVDTTSPEYYRWTQWVFLQLYKAGLAYRDTKEVNFCPDCGTVISDEQVINGRCERHSNTLVERRALPCWFFRITDFAPRLDGNLDWIDWSERTRLAQRDWIGRSEGAEIDFAVFGRHERITVFTTRPDTLFGATFMVVAPDHPVVDAIADPAKRDAIAAYRAEARHRAQVNARRDAVLGDLRAAVERLATDTADIAEAMEAAKELGEARAVLATSFVDAAQHATDTRALTELEAALTAFQSDRSDRKGFVRAYEAALKAMSPDREEKTGLAIGAAAINPATGLPIPIFIADYVLMGYGTGAIMAVPGHDERDFAFAQKFGLPIRCVVAPDARELTTFRQADAIPGDEPDAEALREDILAGGQCWTGGGTAVNSSAGTLSIDGLSTPEAKKRMTELLQARGLGRHRETFRLRDWGISRQRYWGPPIPIIYDEQGNAHPVPEDQLPVTLPPLRDFRPKGDGRGPLANAPDWVNTTLPDGRPGRRETDVMDNFLDSAWYYLRYVSSADAERAYDPELVRKWLPVDIYIGGNEHAVLHLLYTRFICMALEKAGVLSMGNRPGMKDPAEPFRQFRAHGLLIKEGSKMSKSKGNVVNPDKYVEEYGADTLRMYLMFLGPYLQGGDFRDTDVMGVRRFLNRVYLWYAEQAQREVPEAEMPRELVVKLHATIKKVASDFESLSYNTAIAALMELHNALKGGDVTTRHAREALVVMLAPFAPHIAEEIWQGLMGRQGSVFNARFPEFDPALTQLDSVEIAVQVLGKIKARIDVPRSAAQPDVEAAALANEEVRKALEGRAVKRVVVVPGRLVNIIV